MTPIEQPQNPGNEQQGNRSESGSNPQAAQQDTGFENPQRGDKWDNYQTKELSANEGQPGESAEEAAKVFENDGSA